MLKIKSVWGGVWGKVLAALIVLSVVCGVLALTLNWAVRGDVLLTKDDITVSNSVDNGDDTVTVKLRVEKAGFYLSDVKTEKSGDKLMVNFYATVEKSDTYKMDNAGYYSVVFPFDKDTKTIVQEGKDGNEYTLVTLNHKN